MKKRLSELALAQNKRIDYLEQTTSTNDIAAQNIYGHGDVVVAEYQSKGRGQRGNSWASTSLQNLTFTMILAADIHIQKQFYTSKCVTLAIVDTIKSHTGDLDVKIKWPNDIYVGDSKICGILIENDIRGFVTSKSIVGIGLNVNQTQFDSALANPTSMKVCCQRDFNRADVFETLYFNILKYFDMLAQGQESQITELYMDSLYRFEQWATFGDPSRGLFEARIVDVEQDGRLILEERCGNLSGYYFKEIEYKI